MSPIVRVITAKEPEKVFVSIEDIPLVLSDCVDCCLNCEKSCTGNGPSRPYISKSERRGARIRSTQCKLCRSLHWTGDCRQFSRAQGRGHKD